MNFRKIKSLISILVVLSMLITVVPTAFASDEYSKYTDFPTGWSKTAMEHAVDNGLLYGRSATTINPEDYLTRAEMATIINRVFGATIKADISKYTDVKPGDWYYEEIAKAVNMRTFIGDSGSTMNPDENITREAVFTVIARALVLETEDYSSLNAFPDNANVSDWAKSATAILVAKDYVHGNDEGLICPQCYITREEFAQLMYNIVKTYYVTEGVFSEAGKNSSLIRTSGVTLKDVTIDGDLIIGDGVGNGTVLLENVTIKGRLLARGGEGGIKLVNTTVGEYVVVYDVNGTVHFNNYRSEKPFKNIKEITPATFLKAVGGGSSGGTSKTYHTVYFHKGSNPTDFDSAVVEHGKTLAYANKSLATIYSSQITADDILPAYNRNELTNTGLDTTYTHQVNKEYIYEKTPGVWEVFTNTTVVDKDIHVYYAAKHAVAEAAVTLLNLPIDPQIDVRYDSQSRFADSLKDTMITLGNSLEQQRVKTKIDEKITAMYNKINAETGMVDSQGNILDRDYGMKIIDVIDYDQIEAEVDKYINDLIDGTEEEIKNFIALLDMAMLVEEIGGRNLINTVLDNTALRNTMIDSLGSKDQFIVKVIDNGSFNAKIISVLNSYKATLLTLLDDIKAEVLGFIKQDADFVTLINDPSFNGIIVDEVKGSDAFKTLLTGISSYKTNIINEIKTTKLKDLVDIMIVDDDFKKKMVNKVADPGKADADKSELALKTKEAIMNIINTSDEFASLKNDMNRPNAYEAVVQYYVEGHNDSFPNFYISRRDFEEKYKPMIDDVIERVVEEYFAYESNPTLQKPEGYDVMKSYFDTMITSEIDNVLKDYANGVYDSAAEGTTNYKIKSFIDTELPVYIKNALLDYVDPNVQLDASVEGIIDDELINFVKKYLNNEQLVSDPDVAEDIVAVIEENIINFIRNYFAGTVANEVKENEDIRDLANNVKTEFIAEIKAADVDDIKSAVNTYIAPPMTDEEVNELVADFADADMIATYIVNLDSSGREELKVTIAEFLETYDPYTEFMEAFKNKLSEFKVNKKNVHFVSAVGKAIYGFDFNEILEILKTKGFEPFIKFLGEDIIEDIFEASKEDYWFGLEPIVDEVNNSTDANITRYYTTSMNVNINVPLILHGIYNNYADNFKEKIENNPIYDYDENTNLKKFVNLDWFNLFVGYDANRIDEVNHITGYYFKDFMDYYCSMLDIVIIADDALCFYNATDYSDAELVEVKKSLTKDIISLIEQLQSLSDRIESGRPIVGSYTLQDLIDKVDSLNAAVNSFGGSALGSQASNIEAAVDSIKGILEGLGEGNLPNGSTLDDLNILCTKLKTVIEGMNEGQYDSVNATFEELISSAMSRIGAIISELDKDGTIAGRPIDSIVSKISMLNTIYNNYTDEIKKIISALADADIGSLDISINVKEYENIIFGREQDNIFNIDSIIDAVKGKLGTSEKTGYDNGKYIIDKYSKALNGNKVSFQRIFY